jgi:tetratricopeptide (TPR) repeat protein
VAIAWRAWWRSARIRRRVATVALGLGLTAAPLVGTLGYEHAFVLGPIAAAGGIAIGVDAVRGARAEGGATTVRAVLRDAFAELGVLLGLAFVMPLLGQLWQPACEPLGGIAFFLTGPCCSGALGVLAGLYGGLFGSTRARALALGALPMLASTAIGVWRLIADPVVFAFDPFWGYFSGSVYDEAVSVGDTYLRFRGYNLLGAAAAVLGLLAWVGPDLRWRRPAPRTAVLRGLPVVILATATAWIGLRGSSFGFTADLASITEVLSGTRETEHFIIYYAPRSADARTIDAIALEHEFAWAQLREAMGGREPDGKVQSFVFANTDQKRRQMGAGTVQVAAPWRRQIYLDHRAFPHPVLHHELAHIFGATIGDPWFGVSFSGGRLNMGLIEGFATAMAPRESERLDLHDQAGVLRRLEKLPPMGAIMGPGFFTKASQVAYTAAGSFCLYLIETRGFEPMASLYRSAGDFEAAYGTALAELEREWITFLDGRGGVTDDDVAAAAQRFRRPSVFERPCAHRTAELRGEIDRALARGRFAEAIDGYRELCALEPAQPEHGLGLAQALAVDGRWDDARGVLSSLAEGTDLTTSIQAAIAERLGDVELSLGRPDAALAAYRVALALPQSEARLRTLQLREFAAANPELVPAVLAYLSPFDATDDEIVRTVTASWAAREIARHPRFAATGEYLLGRQLLGAERPFGAAGHLERALVDDGAGLPTPEFVRAARVALLESYTMLGRWDDARAVLSRLVRDPDQPHGYLAQWDEWGRRLAFFSTTGDAAATATATVRE